MRRQTNIQRQQHRARFQHSVIRFDQAMAIHAQKRNTIAGRNAQTLQPTSQTARSIRKLRIRKTFASANHSGFLRKLLFCVSQKTDRSQRNFHRSLARPLRRLAPVNH